ncbi:glycoside hydrolase family 31 protein [Pleomorphovibrio marinus]|uniref:glycoside hydrolase family 31 protein n=1 Tax=Pleomorphovibrio marinus TaxID=2164132 RepID=UPI000E0C0F1B|nr:glycoside hydrolase family 31 protein [Pleomorphovibrio marinus]
MLVSTPISGCITPGSINQILPISSGLSGKTENAIFTITQYDPEIVRIQVSRGEDFSPNPYSVTMTPKKGKPDWEDKESIISLHTGKFQVLIEKENLSFRFLDQEGEVLSEDDPNFGINWLGTEISNYRKLQPWEKFIGLGEKTGGLNRWGKVYTNWNTDYFGYGLEADPLYMSIPFFIGLHNGKAYGIFFDNTHKTVFNFGASNNRYSYFSADDGDLDYYFFHADTVAEVISAYTRLTGRMALPPKWALGYQQCRYSYYPDKDVLRLAQTFREKDIPADVIYLDIHHMEAYKVFTFNGKSFPDPAGMINAIKEKGFKIVVILDPGIKTEQGYLPFEEGKKNGLFLKYPDNTTYEGHVWPGWCAFPDFTNPEARKWWGEKMAFYTRLGVDGFWTDMNEPASWGQHTPNIVMFNYEGEPCSHRKGRNVYGLEMAKSTQKGALTHLPDKRPFVLSRSGFSGIQRYAAAWTGDNVANDDHMLLGVRLVNSLGLSGVSFAGYDIGGFAGNTHPNLFARWVSIAAFSPLFRAHSMINSNDSEPWAFGEEVEEISRNYIKFRYEILPTLYSAFYQSHQDGLPIARSLAIDYSFDDKIYHGDFENQYLFCNKWLIAPVVSFKEVTKVYFPEGIWYYLYTDKLFHGNQETYMESPLNYLPVFVKGGAIIAMQNAISHVEEPHDGILLLHVYKGIGNSSHLHYEDEGENLDYRHEAFFKREILLDSEKGSLTLGDAMGDYSSEFSSVKIYFHGFEQKNAFFQDKEHILDQVDVSFMDKMSEFDPLPDDKHTFHQCKGISSITVPHVREEFSIQLY